ncbi:S41 family peptidase [Bryobacter aggregatus]|uniref:S41 family peptidase n=1 Tax=Bryobacter aggregatus TaxID=360054 RepID=UPI0004E157A4|nr:S41 family peptidase [Bryobacter aggregatus]
MTTIHQSQRKEIFRKVVSTTAEKFADPKMNGVNWAQVARETEDAIVSSEDPAEFEKRINELLQHLGTSHIGFFQGERPKSPGRIAISATFLKADTADGSRWMFQDVHPGGLAGNAGIEPGDVLLQLDGIEIVQPVAPTFALATDHKLTIRKRNGNISSVNVSVPPSQSKKRPLIVPDQVVTSRKLDATTGYIRVSMFPGVLGIDVARDILAAAQSSEAQKLVIDLRGNSGGGIGCLRLMSLLCPDKRGVGFTFGRKQIAARASKEALPVFDKIPSSQWGILPLLLKFGLAGRSVAVSSEGLGGAPYHGKVALLINEHSASASEMVAAFASEYSLAQLIGTSTPGKLVAANSFKVGHGYRIALPVGVYYTWQGTKLEGQGVKPHVEVPTLPQDLLAGEDSVLAKALEQLN